MRALSASISLTDMVVSVPFDCPRTLLGAGSSDGSTGAGSFVASGILLSSAAIRSVLKSGFLALSARAFSAWLRPAFGLAGFSSLLGVGLGRGLFGVSALSSAWALLRLRLVLRLRRPGGLVFGLRLGLLHRLGLLLLGLAGQRRVVLGVGHGPALILVTSDGVARSIGMATSGACSILAAGKATSAKSRIAVCSAAEMKVLLLMTRFGLRDVPLV